MGYYILKVNPIPEEDFYAVWSSYTDSPVAWGTFAELEEVSELMGDPSLVAGRKERADKFGTSSYNGFYGFHKEDLVVYEMGYDAPWLLPRENLGPLLGAWEIALNAEGFEYIVRDKDIEQAIMEKYATRLVHED